MDSNQCLYWLFHNSDLLKFVKDFWVSCWSFGRTIWSRSTEEVIIIMQLMICVFATSLFVRCVKEDQIKSATLIQNLKKKNCAFSNDCTVLVCVMIGFLWFTCICLDGLVSHIRWIDSMYIKLDLYIVDMWIGKNVFF